MSSLYDQKPISIRRRLNAAAAEEIVIGTTTGDEWTVAPGTGRLWVLSSAGTMYELAPIDSPPFDMFGNAQEILWTPKMIADEHMLFTTLEPGDADSRFLVCVTAKGRFNKTACERFRDLRQTGVAAIQLDRFDRLMGGMLTSETETVWCVTREGRVSLVPLAHVVPTARATLGLQAVKVGTTGDFIVAAGCQLSSDPLWLFTQLGFVQRVDVRNVPKDLVGKVGVKSVHVGRENGPVVCVAQRPDTDVIHLVTSAGREVPINLYEWQKATPNSSGGAISGVRVVVLAGDEKVVSCRACGPAPAEDRIGQEGEEKGSGVPG